MTVESTRVPTPAGTPLDAAVRPPWPPLPMRLATEGAMAVAARARSLEASGRSIIHFEVGEPDFDTPAHISEAAKQALDAGRTRYGPPLGTPALRAAIAADVAARKGIRADPDRVVVTPGTKAAIFFSILGLVGEGDEVIVTDPGFPIYGSVARYAGARVRPLLLRPIDGFRLDVDALRSLVTPRTRLLVLNSPNNPTGVMLGEPELGEIAQLALGHGFHVIADEIYSRLVYHGEHRSIAALPGMAERTIVIDGFSKTYAMTGWRLGYALVPAGLVEPIARFLINAMTSVPAFVQDAGVAALEGPQEGVDEMAAVFRTRREAIVSALNAVPGFRCAPPAGAFYVFPDGSGTGLTAEELAERLLVEAGVAVLPASAFGDAAPGHLRLSFANSLDDIRDGVERIDRFVRTIHEAASR